MGVLEANEQASSGRPQGARAGRQWASSIEARMQAREAHEQAGGGRPRGARDRSCRKAARTFTTMCAQAALAAGH